MITFRLVLIHFLSLMNFSGAFSTAVQDLQCIITTLKDNHPGACAKDKVFKKRLAALTSLENKIRAEPDQDKALKLIQKSIRNFDDGHLALEILQNTGEQKPKKHRRPFAAYTFGDVLVIDLPTFDPNKHELEQFGALLDDIAHKKTGKKKIIFDLRGNGGGSSALGQQILEVFWGGEHVKNTLAYLQRNEVVWWRASKDNVCYVQNDLLNIVRRRAPEHINEITCLAEQLAQAFENGKKFYQERREAKSLKRIKKDALGYSWYAIIDRQCASAALDFLDYLHVLTSPKLIGTTTGYDSIYMEVRNIMVPSGLAKLWFPIKMYVGRKRRNNQPYKPHVFVHDISGMELSHILKAQKII